MTFMPSMDATQMSNASTQVDNVLRGQIGSAIYVATESGARTTSALTWTAATEGDMINIVRELVGLGYTVTLGTSTLTISWQ